MDNSVTYEGKKADSTRYDVSSKYSTAFAAEPPGRPRGVRIPESKSSRRGGKSRRHNKGP